jgi:hypothetical protein
LDGLGAASSRGLDLEITEVGESTEKKVLACDRRFVADHDGCGPLLQRWDIGDLLETGQRGPPPSVEVQRASR